MDRLSYLLEFTFTFYVGRSITRRRLRDMGEKTLTNTRKDFGQGMDTTRGHFTVHRLYIFVLKGIPKDILHMLYCRFIFQWLHANHSVCISTLYTKKETPGSTITTSPGLTQLVYFCCYLYLFHKKIFFCTLQVRSVRNDWFIYLFY